MTDDPEDIVHAMQERGAAERRATALRMAEQRKLGPKIPAAKKRGTPERDIQRTCVAYLRLCGCLVSATINEQRSLSDDPNERARYGAARKKSGAETGFPDITVITSGGVVLFVEFKSGVGRLSEAQRRVHAWLTEHGQIVVTCASLEAMQAGLRAAGVVVGARSRPMAPPVAPLKVTP